MDCLLYTSHTPLQAVVILSIIIAVGLGLGKIHLFGISLGVTFVFFAGILAGHLGFSIDSNMLNYAESFGLVLFVYELGLQVGPGFFSSFRKGGVQLNMLGMGVILTGTVMTVLFSKLGDIPMSDMVAVSYTHLLSDIVLPISRCCGLPVSIHSWADADKWFHCAAKSLGPVSYTHLGQADDFV